MLEVLVGLVILAVSLGVLFQIFAAALRATTLAQDYAQAAVFAGSTLARLGIDEPLEEGVRGADIDGKFRRTVVVRPYADEDGEIGGALRPYEVTVEVGWGEGEKARSVVVTTARLVTVE